MLHDLVLDGLGHGHLVGSHTDVCASVQETLGGTLGKMAGGGRNFENL